MKDSIVQGGDFVKNNGTGSFCALTGGDFFPDENVLFEARWTRLAVDGELRQGPQRMAIFVTLRPLKSLDGKNVVFGRLIGDDALAVFRRIGSVATDRNLKPLRRIAIVESGEM